MAGVAPDQEHGGPVAQDLPREALPLAAAGRRHGGVPQGDPGQQPSQHGPEAGQEKREFGAADGNGHPADGEGKCVAAGGAGDEVPHGHAPAAGDVMVGDDHDPGGVGAAQGVPTMVCRIRAEVKPRAKTAKVRLKTPAAKRDQRCNRFGLIRSATLEQTTRETA